MTNTEKETAALQECRKYLGGKYSRILGTMRQAVKGRSRTVAYRQVRFMCEMVGIRGYWPVRAMARKTLKGV
jgi:hypothetical protein